MSKAAKVWLIIAVCLLLIGAAIFALALATRDTEMFSLKKNLKTVVLTIDGDFRDISIDSQTEDIRLIRSEDDTCRVVFEEREGTDYRAEVKGETLEIRTNENAKWYEQLVLVASASPKITVYLPKSEYGQLTVKEHTGDVQLPEDLTFGGMDLQISTGDIDCASPVKGLLRAKTSTGDIRLEDLTADDLHLTVTTGKAEVRRVTCGGVEISVSTGKAVLTDVSCSALTSSGSTGDILLENVTVSGEIKIERSTGDVRFDGADAAEITVKTSTGSVSGSLLSPKIFVTQSKTGHIRVPESTAGGTCRITTTTGNISIAVK